MIVVQPNGLFARFSSIVDHFTHYNYTEEEIVQLYIEMATERARRDAAADIAAARGDSTRYERVLETISHVHGDKEAVSAGEMCNEPPSD